MKRITSRDNPAIKLAVKLKNRKNRTKEKLFLIEGRKMIKEALTLSGTALKSIFVTDEVMKEYEILAEKYPDIDWLIVDDKLMQYICDTETPQGVAGIACIPTVTLDDLMKKADMLLLLDQISDPGNLGTIIRTAWAFNIGGIMLTTGSTDPFSPKVVRASMGGILHVPIATEVKPEDFRVLKDKGYIFMATDVKAAKSYEDADYKGPKVIVIGSEAHGISPEVINLCDEFFTIPINPKADSLNAAIACAIILSKAAANRNT